jgi:hypothetical protein
VAYTPNNDAIFIAAFSGAVSGMTLTGVPKSITPSDYDKVNAVAGAWAQAFDTAWGANPSTTLDDELAQSMCAVEWTGRAPATSSLNPSFYTPTAAAIIAEMKSAENYFTAQGISPNPPTPPLTPGNLNEIQFAVGLATVSSATSLPPGAVINFVSIVVVLGYSVGATISVGRAGAPTLLMAPGDSDVQVIDEYEALQTTQFGGASLPILATVAGGPAVGAALVTVKYSLPNS